MSRAELRVWVRERWQEAEELRCEEAVLRQVGVIMLCALLSERLDLDPGTLDRLVEELSSGPDQGP